MRVLVVGGGGREHALVWKLHQNPEVKALACAPGNGGISGLANCITNVGAGDIENLAAFAYNAEMDLMVVGPEAPLTAGVVDFFKEKVWWRSDPAKRRRKSKAASRSPRTS